MFSVDLHIWFFFLDWNKLEFYLGVVLLQVKEYCFQTFSYKFKKLMNVCTYNNNLLHKIKLQTSENVLEVRITLLKCIQYTKTFTSIMYSCIWCILHSSKYESSSKKANYQTKSWESVKCFGLYCHDSFISAFHFVYPKTALFFLSYILSVCNLIESSKEITSVR